MFNTLYPLNLIKSIEGERLSYKLTFSYVFDYFFSFFAVAITLFMGFAFLTKATRNLPQNTSLLLTVVILVIITVWLFTNIYFTNKLVKVKGGYAANNKIELNSLLNKRFKRLNKIVDQPYLVVYYREPRFVGLSIIITCLFDGKKLYLNITSLGKGDGPLPFSGLHDYFTAKKLLKEFKINSMPQ